MSPLIELLNGWSAAWLGLVWAVAWQSTAVAAVAGSIAFLLRRSVPALRYWVWQIVAIKLLLMPLWNVWIPLPAGFRTPSAAFTAMAERPRPGADFSDAPPAESTSVPAQTPANRAELAQHLDPSLWGQISWPSWLSVAWLTVIVWRVGGILSQRLALARLLARMAPAPDESLNVLLIELARQVGLRRAPAAALIDDECSPFVCGIWRPALVLPRSLLTALAPAQLRQVLLHELAHVKRLDLVWGWVPEIARLLYWFHPVVHWVYYRIQLERELACDQLAIVHSGQGAASYADTLVQIVGRASGSELFQTAAASAGFPGGPHLTPNE